MKKLLIFLVTFFVQTYSIAQIDAPDHLYGVFESETSIYITEADILEFQEDENIEVVSVAPFSTAGISIIWEDDKWIYNPDELPAPISDSFVYTITDGQSNDDGLIFLNFTEAVETSFIKVLGIDREYEDELCKKNPTGFFDATLEISSNCTENLVLHNHFTDETYYIELDDDNTTILNLENQQEQLDLSLLCNGEVVANFMDMFNHFGCELWFLRTEVEFQETGNLIEWIFPYMVDGNYFVITRIFEDTYFYDTLYNQINTNVTQNLSYFDEITTSGIYYYNVALYKENGCEIVGAWDFLRKIRIGEDELILNNFYPNPTPNILKLEILTSNQQSILVQIFNISSNLVFSETFEVQAQSAKSIELDVSSFLQGEYYCVISDGKKTIVEPFVKM